MTELLIVLVAGLLVIAAATLFGRRLGVASPLLLVGIGVAVSFLPAFDAVSIDPELILAGVLPPLLYASAVSMPAMNFRREFGAISGLSVVLVVGSALLLGVFFMLVFPQLGFAWGVALGAIVSPTDAVATAIVKRTPASRRVVAMLDGESLLNDATALVLLRTAIAAAAASFSFWGALGTFAYSVAIAVVIGALVGWANLVLRKRVTDATVNTVISFTVPFLASIPAELLGASGLVAAVVAGLVTGVRGPRKLSPQNRFSDSQNWRTVELVLEAAVFLSVGLQIRSTVMAVEGDHGGARLAVLIAAAALLLVLLIRAAYIAPLLVILSRRSRRAEQLQGRLHGMRDRASRAAQSDTALEELNARRRRKVSSRDLEHLTTWVTRGLADIDYFLRQPLGWREGTIAVWAGMRGAVTAAAAQTLPADTPQRPVLVLVAFAVATISILVQGGTVGWLVRRITPPVSRAEADQRAADERKRLREVLEASSADIPEPADAGDDPNRQSFDTWKRYRIAVLNAQRTALLDARDDGLFDAELLSRALTTLDASQIDIQMRGEPLR